MKKVWISRSENGTIIGVSKRRRKAAKGTILLLQEFLKPDPSQQIITDKKKSKTTFSLTSDNHSKIVATIERFQLDSISTEFMNLMGKEDAKTDS